MALATSLRAGQDCRASEATTLSSDSKNLAIFSLEMGWGWEGGTEVWEVCIGHLCKGWAALSEP